MLHLEFKSGSCFGCTGDAWDLKRIEISLGGATIVNDRNGGGGTRPFKYGITTPSSHIEGWIEGWIRTFH